MLQPIESARPSSSARPFSLQDPLNVTEDAWGNLQAGSTTPGYAFTGREWDPETNLYYYRARYYDPKAGRFISEDPIGFGSGTIFYTYVENSPVNFTDPSGMVLTPPPGMASGLAQAAGGFWDFVRNWWDTRRANTINGDQYFHCMANCEASRRGAGGGTMSVVMSDAREWFDQNVKRDPPWASAQDQACNLQGRSGARNIPCSQVCANLRPPGLPPGY